MNAANIKISTEVTALCKQRKGYLTVIQVGLYQSAFKTGLDIPDIITVLEREKTLSVIEDKFNYKIILSLVLFGNLVFCSYRNDVDKVVFTEGV